MMPREQLDVLHAYVEGVNSGLAALDVKPFEYLLLNQQPTPWQVQDSVAVIYAMALDLTKEEAKAEQLASLLRQQLPQQVADYLLATGSRWDAPLAGDVYQQPPVPDAAVWRMSLLGDSNGDNHVREQLESSYGPVLKHDPEGNPLAVRWTQYFPQAANLNLMHLEQAQNVNDAVAIGNTAGIPPQNLMLADSQGNIAWTIAGVMPVRHYDGSQLVPWQLAGDGFSDWLAPQDYPRVLNPQDGQLQTANSRVASGVDLLKLGDGGYDLGIRQRQIRDHLAKFNKADEQDMLSVQLDDEAQFYGEWYQLMREHLHNSSDTSVKDLLTSLEDWDGHAAVDSVAYSLVREYRLQVRDRVWAPLEAMVKAKDEDLSMLDWRQLDGPLWHLLQEQPAHWLNPAFASWQALYNDAATGAYKQLLADAGSVDKANWGKLNEARIQHPLSRAVPQLSWLLDMPADPQSGDSFLPKVAGNNNGASERFAVSPGKESQGYFHMPGGQSGHPLSPYYGAGHQAWQQGIPTPFLPSEAQQSLILEN